jgi:hypothetical protein
MTGNDLIVMAPWIIFGAGLSAVCIQLLSSRRASRHLPERSRSAPTGPSRSADQRPAP